MNIQRLNQAFARQTIDLLGLLRVSLLGVHSRRLHTVLVNDGLRERIDCRIAVDAERVAGVVLAAPASYWRSLILEHWGIAIECIRVRARAHRRPPKAARRVEASSVDLIHADEPPRSWAAPGDAWRIIFIGTAPDARGKGIAAELYRTLMAERSLVARIALDNTPSIRLHQSVGWRLYRDRNVVLGVYLRPERT